MLPRHLFAPLNGAAARLPLRSNHGVAGVCRASANRSRPVTASLPPRRPYSDSTSAASETPNTEAAVSVDISNQTSPDLPIRKIPYPPKSKKPKTKQPTKQAAATDKATPTTTASQNKPEPKPEVYYFQPDQIANAHRILTTKPNLWLRDACSCDKCVDPHSGQKSFATTELDFLPEAKSVERADDGSLTVVWANDPVSGGADHTSVYPRTIEDDFYKFPRRDLWDRDIYDQDRDKCRVSYEDWMAGGSEFWDAMAALSAKGLVFVYDVPQGDEAAVERMAAQIGGLQETFYGSTWDVVSKPRAENVAYTNQFLGLHQDLLYYPDPPRVQLLHCLANECEGGESLFSDGVFAATVIRTRRSPTFAALCSYPTVYHYNKNGNAYRAERPIVDAVADPVSGAVENVWWSPPFQAPFSLNSTRIAPWHLAASQFQAEIERPEAVVEHRLRGGECVVFDNWRVLHGRKEFDPQSGNRHLKGTYVDDATYRAKFDEMPEPIARRHSLWTDRRMEFFDNRQAVLGASGATLRFRGDKQAKAANEILGESRKHNLSSERALTYLQDLLGRDAESVAKELVHVEEERGVRQRTAAMAHEAAQAEERRKQAEGLTASPAE
ncbi:hypothetical protein GE09DRAFT_1141881 [Coniochaeta sp. 2T2.1]|nr:hypothetical protein GE09DRAFT_1141881 [Coniochaeta sp. 2T2.1]